MCLHVDPIPTYSLFVVFKPGIPLERAAISQDGTGTRHIILIAGNEYPIDAELPGLQQCKSQHLRGISFPALIRADGISDVPTVLRKIII